MGKTRRQPAHQLPPKARKDLPAPTRPAAPQPHPRKAWPLEAYAAALVLATVLAYLPTFTAGFVRWDDQYYVEDNNLLADPDALKKIWNPLGHDTQQFYPLVFSTYWLEYRLWGLDPHSYHVVNVGLHVINVLLVLSVALELGVATATAAAAAAIFALHPVQVASVAWISELKNTLAALFYLLAVLAYVRHRRTGAWAPYGWCLLAFVAALLSKTQTVMLPASLLLLDWALQRLGRIQRASPGAVIARVLPMLALGALAGIITMRFEQSPWTREFTLAERVLVSTNAVVFYARTLLAPFWLSPIYPEWDVASADWRWWIAPALCALAVGVIGLARRRIPALVTWGIAHFYVALVPVLGLFSFNFQTYTLVADHFLYFSLLGGGIAVALGVKRAAELWTPQASQQVVAGVGCLLLLGLGIQTYVECTHWRSNLTFWTRVRDRDPNGFLANFNLGNHYRYQGQWAQAVPFYRRAAEIRTRVEFPFIRYAEALEHASGPEAVIVMCTHRLARDPGFYPAYLERGMREEKLGRVEAALKDYESTLRIAPRDAAQAEDASQRRARLMKPTGDAR